MPLKPATGATENTKDDLDLVIFYEGDYYYLPRQEWQAARKLGEGEAVVLSPLIHHGTVVAHNDAQSSTYGSWNVTLVNMSALRGACKSRGSGKRQRRRTRP